MRKREQVDVDLVAQYAVVPEAEQVAVWMNIKLPTPRKVRFCRVGSTTSCHANSAMDARAVAATVCCADSAMGAHAAAAMMCCADSAMGAHAAAAMMCCADSAMDARAAAATMCCADSAMGAHAAAAMMCCADNAMDARAAAATMCCADSATGAHAAAATMCRADNAMDARAAAATMCCADSATGAHAAAATMCHANSAMDARAAAATMCCVDSAIGASNHAFNIVCALSSSSSRSYDLRNQHISKSEAMKNLGESSNSSLNVDQITQIAHVLKSMNRCPPVAGCARDVTTTTTEEAVRLCSAPPPPRRYLGSHVRSRATQTESTKFLRDLQRKIEQLEREIIYLRASQLRGSPYSRDYFTSDATVCYYHKKIGAEARKCHPPCAWELEEGAEGRRPHHRRRSMST
ncbi:uncharacterized protein LOC126381328 [Pectinophora gossypiella]|uniref:uncharacterized protein LOC126381328 n=1 Tax=Pectinophora gossypiella TaxID=13191 RepID=UPI00214E353A|nr:uncharacterized protein LOC126381328 [Pectinophora gossypiella]